MLKVKRLKGGGETELCNKELIPSEIENVYGTGQSYSWRAIQLQ